jgi:hypothetical protein
MTWSASISPRTIGVLHPQDEARRRFVRLLDQGSRGLVRRSCTHCRVFELTNGGVAKHATGLDERVATALVADLPDGEALRAQIERAFEEEPKQGWRNVIDWEESTSIRPSLASILTATLIVTPSGGVPGNGS